MRPAPLAPPTPTSPGGAQAQQAGELLRTFAASLLVLLLSLAALLHATQGGAAFTTENLRRAAVARAPQAVPDFALVDASGRQQPLLQRLAATGPEVWIVDFVYTRCATLCLALGTAFQQLQAEIVAQGLQGRVGLLSISFDPAYDRPEALAAYARRMRMEPGVWELASLADPADRRRLLDSFGIMVVPAPLGEYEHNAALHLVTADGRLVRILGLEQGAQALALAAALAGPAAGSGPVQGAR